MTPQSPSTKENLSHRSDDADWYRSAVVYQVYPRSFADSDGDGTGDIGGLIFRLPYIHALGVDAIWVNPWYPSPLHDGGYDVSDYRDIHPDFGTLEQADEFVHRAHALGLKVLLDLVPNHCSNSHPWFQAALKAGPGSAERELFVFRDGKGKHGEQPPTNWTAMFGGSAWQRVVDDDGNPEQWYLHLFAAEQPDWNWENPRVHEEFDSILRFWFDRGLDGFRIDVADSMAKDQSFPDMPIDPSTGVGTLDKYEGSPIFDQPHVHDIHREWRRIADSYADSDQGARVFVGEAYLNPAHRLAQYVHPDELQTTFNFDALKCAWDAASQRRVIDATRDAIGSVGAPCTWVLANHDTVRPASRYGKASTGVIHTESGIDHSAQPTHAELEAMPTDVDLGRRRFRAASLLELALPGGAYIYQGGELGLEEVEDLPEESLQDPTWLRSGRTIRGRDGCRIPIPWSGTEPPFGFSPDGSSSLPWLPQPAHWANYTVEAQDKDPGSMLTLYRTLLAERKANPALGDGDLSWDDDVPDGVLSFRRDPGFRCIVNISQAPYPMPAGAELIAASDDVSDGKIGVDCAVWLRV